MAQDNDLNKYLKSAGITTGLSMNTQIAQAKLAMGIQPSQKEIRSMVQSQFYQNQNLERAIQSGQSDLRFGMNTPNANIARIYNQSRQGPAQVASQMLQQPQYATQRPASPAQQAMGSQGQPSSINIAGREFPALSQQGPSINIAGRSFAATQPKVTPEYINKAVDYINQSNVMARPQDYTPAGVETPNPDDYNPAVAADGGLGGSDFNAAEPPPKPRVFSPWSFSGQAAAPAAAGVPQGNFGSSAAINLGIGKITIPPSQSAVSNLPPVTSTQGGNKQYTAEDLLKKQGNLPEYLRINQAAAPATAQQAAPQVVPQVTPQVTPQAYVQQGGQAMSPMPQAPEVPATNAIAPQRAPSVATPSSAGGAPTPQPYNPFSSMYAPLVSESIYGHQGRAQAEHQQKMALDTYKANVESQSKSLRDYVYTMSQGMNIAEKQAKLMADKAKMDFANSPANVQVMQLDDGSNLTLLQTAHGKWTHIKSEKGEPSNVWFHPIGPDGNEIQEIWQNSARRDMVRSAGDPLMAQLAARMGGGSVIVAPQESKVTQSKPRFTVTEKGAK